MSSGYLDASDMLAEALKQMDGLLADTVQSVGQQNGHQTSRPGSQKGPQHVNGSQQGPTSFKSSPKLQSRIVQQINDLQTTLSGVDDRMTILNRLDPETKQFFQKWMLQSDQTNGKEMLSSRVHPEPHKLDLMAENSSLKVKLARAEKELQDSDEKLTTAQSRINELQSRLNDRTIELTELRTRLARSAPSSPERSLSNSFKDKTIEREKTIERLKRKHFEVEKLKDAVESLLVSNEEKNSKIDELHNALKRYQKLEELVLKLQGPKALEQCFDDDDSNFGSAQNSNSSSNENVLNNLRMNVDPVSGMPYPTATSAPVNLHSVESLSNGHHRLQPEPCSPSSAGHRASSPVNTGARSSSFDNVITGSKTPPTVKRRADGFGTLPKDIYLRDVQQGPIRPLGYMTVPYSPLTVQNRPPVPPHAVPVQPPTQTSRSNTMPRKHRAFMSFAKPDADEETLKDELAQEYRAIQNQPTDEVTKKKSNKGIKRLFGKLKRSNSQELDDDKTEDFKRAGLRSTAGPRLGWSKELNDLDMPFARWDTDRVALWLHVMGLSMYVGECKRWVKNGDQLLTATSHDLEKELGIRNHFHRKKLQLALQVISTDLHSPMAHLDHTWVTKWLDDIGLPQYKDQFSDARIDGRTLNYMTVDDLVNLKVTNLLHHYSFKRGIQVLRNNNFAASCLKRRPAPDEGILHNCPDEVMLWTNHRVMEWLRSIDLSEYAPNLRGSGVHGALMVLEPRFGAEIFATILSIPNNKTLLRRHLSTHFVALIGNAVQQQKREHEADPNYLPLTPSHKVKVKKGIFRSIRADGREDFVCPMDPRQDRNLPCPNNSSPLSRTSVPREEDEKLDNRAARQIGAFSQEKTALTAYHGSVTPATSAVLTSNIVHAHNLFQRRAYDQQFQHLLAKDHRYLDSVPTSEV